MGELADRVARLEREVTEAQEALRVVAKIDEEIENALEEVADRMHEARQEATSDRAARAGRFLMELCDHLAETVWPEVTGALRRTDLEKAARALKEASMAGKTAPAVYKLYEVNLSVQYESSPYSLGAVGEQLMAFESWLGAEGRG
ncbi:hypothetical protein [Streptomyces sp. SID8352]|uniref:hypothetical protein n=1 Tax=Streptomyces sp. SID8352 TaxID=2690338 RepID=UPI00136E802D|nr:hypothetical protein [Streptomyces sp. SID8352]MYU24381.1 hypothetical protein [Streptomyces sp. SID8352]